MIAALIHFFLLQYILFVESRPTYDSIARDLRIIGDCNSTYPTDRMTLNVALEAKRFQVDPDENFKCFLFCLYNKYDWMTPDGAFKGEEMKTTLEESNLDESSIEYLLTTCTEIDLEDKCDRAHQFTECFWTETEKLVNLTKTQ